MGFFKSLGKVLGKAAKYAAPALALTGVGAPVAAAIGAGGAALEKASSGGNLGDAVKAGALGAAGGLAGGVAGKAVGGATASKSILQKALGFAKANPQLLLGAAGAIQSAAQQSSANKKANAAIDIAKQDYASRGPLRQLILQQALGFGQPQAPLDLSAGFNMGNPYQQLPARASVGGTTVPATLTTFTGAVEPGASPFTKADVLRKAVRMGAPRPTLGTTPTRGNQSLQPA